MTSFLNHCAKHLQQSYQARLASTCVVLPTRRSGLVLEKNLVKIGTPNLPKIMHLEEFIAKMSGFEKTVSVMLLLELFEVFSEIDKNIKLERFTSWGYILLKDFDQIDRNLINAKQLFANLKDVKNLERWRLGEDRITKRIDEYFELWNNLDKTYQEFRKKLLAQNKGYGGLMYRHLAENAEQILIKNKPFEQYVFMGLNALSKSEELIFKTLIDAEKAELIWDADNFYMQDDDNKAGLFLKKYKRNWAGTNWKFQCDDFKKSRKDLQVISVANASVQGKVANQLLRNWSENAKDQDLIIPKTSLVLGDEHILLSVLSSLDEQFEGLNITIGLSLKDSALFNLVDVIFEQNQTSIADKSTQVTKFSYRTIIRILSHPSVRQFEKKHCESTGSTNFILLLVSFINQNNLIFLSRDELLDITNSPTFQETLEEEQVEYCKNAQVVFEPLFRVLFQKWKNTFELIKVLEELTKLLYNEDDFFEAAYYREFQNILARLKGFVYHRPKFIDVRTFKIFLYQAFRETSFEFDSDKEHNLQLMGIVETRNLDFENVIVLSVNESILPRAKKPNSFIPVDVAKAFDLPTYTEQDAIVSYHFYRLLQRAKKIALVYVAPSDTYGGKEKSRFILQLENDLKKYNPKIKIREIPARFRVYESEEEDSLTIEKTPEIIEKIKANFSKGLTPSQINNFIACSLRYYFSQVANIGEASKVQESLGADKLGSLVHEILEDVFYELSLKSNFIQVSDIQSVIPSIEERVAEKFNLDKYSAYVITGQNYIVKEVTTKFILSFLESQVEEIQSKGVPFEILMLENKEITDHRESYSPTISSNFIFQHESEPIPVVLKGITDRIDKVGDKVRIIDYKTGKVEQKQMLLEKDELSRLVEDEKARVIRQAWLYKYIIAKRILEGGSFQVGKHSITASDTIEAGIYSLRNLKEGFLELKSKDKKSENSIFPKNLSEYVKTSEEYLSKILENMLDSAQIFEKTEERANCMYCAYKGICGR